MTTLDQIEAAAAEACVAGFKRNLSAMLAEIEAMEELNLPMAEIADRIGVAWKEIGLRAALASGRVAH